MLTRTRTPIATPARGFSLMEVLVSLLILSVGLLGLAGLLLISVRVNQGAYQRTQATALGESLANRMRANTRALWASPNPYAGSYPRSGNTAACGAAAPCDFAAVAVRDAAIWSQELSNALPNAAAVVECVRNSATAIADPSLRPPYDATCSVRLSWSETPLDQGGSVAPQTFAWVFQP